MTDRDNQADWFPVWVDRLDLPVWITDPHRKVSYINGDAERLLGRTADECIGHPCYRVIDGTDGSGGSYCGPRCPVVAAVESRRGLRPVRVQIPGPDNQSQWIAILVIPVTAPDETGPWLVHCVLGSWSPWSVPFRMGVHWNRGPSS